MSLPDGLATSMAAALGADGVIGEPEQLSTYECDGLTGHRVVPALVVLPRARPPRFRPSSGSATSTGPVRRARSRDGAVGRRRSASPTES